MLFCRFAEHPWCTRGVKKVLYTRINRYTNRTNHIRPATFEIKRVSYGSFNDSDSGHSPIPDPGLSLSELLRLGPQHLNRHHVEVWSGHQSGVNHVDLGANS